MRDTLATSRGFLYYAPAQNAGLTHRPWTFNRSPRRSSGQVTIVTIMA
jgi:hypothetical protein